MTGCRHGQGGPAGPVWDLEPTGTSPALRSGLSPPPRPPGAMHTLLSHLSTHGDAHYGSWHSSRSAFLPFVIKLF